MPKGKRPNAIRKIIAVSVIVICLIALPVMNGQSQGPQNLTASFINVGQGDSALLQDPNGFDVLIDGGVAGQGDEVLAYLRQRGIDDIDVLVASHADADHVGGLLTVLQANDIPVEAVVYNGYPGDTATWQNFMNAVALEGLTPTVAQFPQEFNWGEMTVHVLNPAGGLSNPETNDASLVLRVDYGDINLLFTGDIDTVVESAVIARGTPMASEFLKVAHHGSAYGTSDAFLAAGDPVESIISVGQNSYGHPDEETAQRLLASGSKIWRTDKNGNIVIVTDGFSYVLTPEFLNYLIHLPLILHETPVPTTVTPEPTTATPTTVTPTTVTPVPGTGNVQIVSVFADGAGTNEPDEYLVIQNLDTTIIQLQGWTLRDNASHVFTFPSFQIQPGQVCRVYTNQSHPETCGFNYGSGSAIWNNGGDCAYLRNAQGVEVDNYCY